jgi:hypothetical protein
MALQGFVGRLKKDEVGPAPKNKKGEVSGPKPVIKEGEKIQVFAGQLFDANHPVVKAFPTMFGQPDLQTARSMVEQATASPGEKRA